VPGHRLIELVAYYPEFVDYYLECELQTKRWFVENIRRERSSRNVEGSEAAPLVLNKAANTFVEVSGGLSVSRFKQSGDGSSKMVPDQGLLHVATSPAAWSFAVLFPLSQDASLALNRCTAMPALVRIQISVDHGKIGVGMLYENYRHITGERLVKASLDAKNIISLSLTCETILA
jgi:hypothetical protein